MPPPARGATTAPRAASGTTTGSRASGAWGALGRRMRTNSTAAQSMPIAIRAKNQALGSRKTAARNSGTATAAVSRRCIARGGQLPASEARSTGWAVSAGPSGTAPKRRSRAWKSRIASNRWRRRNSGHRVGVTQISA